MGIRDDGIRSMPVRLAADDVMSCLGSRDREYPALDADVVWAIGLANELCVPRAVRRRLAVETAERDRVSFALGPTLTGRFMAHLLEGAHEAEFIVLTIGPALEDEVARLFVDGDAVEAFILDAAGSAVAMNMLTELLTEISEEAGARDWHVGACLSPGQSYWDVTGQAAIFQAVPAEEIGVELLESSFLRPQKSQTAVVPLGAELKVHGHDDSSCRYCPATNCPLRLEPQSVG